MTHLASFALLATLAPLVGCATEGVSSDDLELAFPASRCSEIVDQRPDAVDGEYTLSIQNQANLPWTAYCADMQGTPREYLTLVTGGGKNTSMFAGASDVVTEYQRVRIDPATFAIDVSDQTFAISTGSALYKGKTVTSMPFGVALACGGYAAANIDLTGTPFRIADPFPVVGANLQPSFDLSLDRKTLDFSVEGSCGWIGPDHITSDPVNKAGSFVLPLAYFR